MAGRFLIEDDYYISRDPYCFILSRYTGKEIDGSPVYESLTFHSKPEDALLSYLHIRQGEKLKKADNGTIKEMIDILSAENKRLQNVLKSAFSAVCDIDMDS